MSLSESGVPSYITLSALARQVRGVIDTLPPEFWVVAELAKVNVNSRSGHCYLELVEKKGEATVASMKAAIWAGVYKRLSSVFRKATGTDLKQGMKVLMRGSMNFHEVYGLSLNVREVDPAYTLGEMALKRKETLERLSKEGLIDLNRSIPVPMVPQRIAIVASETSAGYGDFMHRMTGNPYGYAYALTIFPALMQGDKAEESIASALAAVRLRVREFDVLVMIRGGGSQVDLSCFDSYALACEVARFPLPVLSGIGHERDETVLDRVSKMRLITPSAVAEFIVSTTRRFEDRLDALRHRLVKQASDLVGHEHHRIAMASSELVSSARALLSGSRHRLISASNNFSSLVRESIGRASARLDRLSDAMRHGTDTLLSGAQKAMLTFGARLRAGAGYRLRREPSIIETLSARLTRAPRVALSRASDRLTNLEAKARLLDPRNVLMRGYSITVYQGRAIKDASDINNGDRLKTILYKGEITSTVDDTHKEGENV